MKENWEEKSDYWIDRGSKHGKWCIVRIGEQKSSPSFTSLVNPTEWDLVDKVGWLIGYARQQAN
jgi:hypothetical protein